MRAQRCSAPVTSASGCCLKGLQCGSNFLAEWVCEGCMLAIVVGRICFTAVYVSRILRDVDMHHLPFGCQAIARREH